MLHLKLFLHDIFDRRICIVSVEFRHSPPPERDFCGFRMTLYSSGGIFHFLTTENTKSKTFRGEHLIMGGPTRVIHLCLTLCMTTFFFLFRVLQRKKFNHMSEKLYQ